MALNFLNDSYFAAKVGIGTEIPSSSLTVEYNNIVNNHTPAVFLKSKNSLAGSGDVLDVYANRGNGFTDGYIAKFRNDVDTKLYIRGDGNVGIGTESPTTRLNTVVTVNTEKMVLGAASGGFKVGNTTGNEYGINMGVGDSGSSWIQVGRTDGTATAYNLSLQAAGGNVGIGRGATAAQGDTDLIVQDSTAASSTAQVQILGGTTGFSNLYFSDTSTYNVGGFIYNHSSNYLVTNVNGSEKMRISSAGAVKFNSYNSANLTGNPTFLLGTDASGNVVKTDQNDLYNSRIVLIDTPNGGLKACRVISDEYGEWIVVGRFAASAMNTIQSVWSSVSGLSTGTAQSETTQFSADFGDSYPSEVRIMGSTDFTQWRPNRTIDWVYKVPTGRKWKFFFSNGATNGMATVDGVKQGWTVNGAYDGFGRWTNSNLVSIRMSDIGTPVLNPSAAYTTATSNAFNWETMSDAKFSVSATRVFCGQDTFVTSGVGNDDNIAGFFDEYPSETTNMQGGVDFSSAVWVLIKLPASAGDGPYLPLAGGIMVGNILMGNTVVNPVSGFADQSGIGLKYSTTIPELQVSSDSIAMQLGRTTTGGEGQILSLRRQGTNIHTFSTNAVSIGTDTVILGDVGIGTVSPNAKLDVNGVVTFSANTDGKNTFQFTTGAAVDDARLLMRSVDTVKVDIQANGVSYFNGGNVGIRTTSPNYILDIVNDASGIVSLGLNGSRGAADNRVIANIPIWNRANGVGDIQVAGLEILNGITSNQTQKGQFVFKTNDGSSLAERMRINSDGNVGIGTANPGVKLNVQGTILVNNEIQFVNTSVRIFRSGDDMRFRTAGSDRVTIQSGGNVGIGVTNPTLGKLQVASVIHVNRGGTNGLLANPYFESILQSGLNLTNLSSVQLGNSFGSDNGTYIRFQVNSTAAASTPLNILTLKGTGGVTLGTYTGSAQTGTPTYILGTDASGNVVKVLGADIPGVPGGSGTLNTVPLWTPDGDTLGDSMISQATTSNVVMKGAGNDFILNLDPDNNAIGDTSTVIFNDRARVGWFNSAVYLGDNGQNKDIKLQTNLGDIISLTSNTERMRIKFDTGNVGIDVTNPGTKLDVDGVIKARGGSLSSPNDNRTDVGVVITENDFIYTLDNSGAYLRRLIGKVSDIIQIGEEGTSLISGINLKPGTTGGYVQIFDNNSVVAKFVDGKLGIGVTSPLQKLVVQDGDGGGTGGSGIDSRTKLLINANTEAYLTFNVPALSFTGQRYMIAGTTKASVELWDYAADPQFRISSVDSRPLTFATQNAEKMRISPGGSVKFNTYDSTNNTGTPTYLLGTDASGNVVKTLTTPSPVTSQAASLYDLIPNGAFTTTYAFTSTAGTYAEVMEGNDVITAAGTYSVQMYVDDYAVGGTQYREYYSGVMSWNAPDNTNDDGLGAISEIVLHRAGHAANQGMTYLRTRESGASETNKLKLEIMCNRTYSGASNVVFKFVRLI